MKTFSYLLLGLSLFFISCGQNGHTSATETPAEIASLEAPEDAKPIYQFELQDIEGNAVSLDQYKGKVLLVVNVASKCGYTPQYEDLQAFYEKYKEKGVVILGFPANNFGGQEPGSNAEIQQFCKKNYGVSFPMFAKISVKGDDTHPLYQYLTDKGQNGRIDAKISWNFNKFLIDREGYVVEHFKSGVKPQDGKFMDILQELL